MKISITQLAVRCSMSATLGLYSLLGVAASPPTPEICSAAATATCCYTTCVAMKKKYIHGSPAKYKCKKECLPHSR